MGRQVLLLAPLFSVTLLGACSLFNAPGKEVPGGSGGNGGTGGSSCGDCSALDDDCNKGVCKAGSCVKEASNEGKTCDDGDFCTENDTCHTGKCRGDTKKCPAKDDCHPASCDEQQQKCVASVAADGTKCDDGDPCTGDGQCASGTCQKGQSLCDSAPFTTTCSQGSCTPNGCVGVPINEGVMCTEGIAPECATGACSNGTCVATPKMNSDGTPCASSKFCIVGTSCQQGACTGGAKRKCPTPSPCEKPDCDETTDQCTLTPLPDGAACDDGTGCNVGTTCHNDMCKNPTHQITECISGDSCCPAGCSAGNDTDCLYWASGVQKNVPVTSLEGWTRCFIDTYDDYNFSTAAMLQACNGQSILMGCGQYDAASGDVPVLQIAAMADRASVFNNCGSDPACTVQANGVGFYWSDSYSWGFAPGGAPVQRNSCDVDVTDPNNDDGTGALRMCVHTSGQIFQPGYRCGFQFLNGDPSYARVAYTSPLPPP